MMSIVVSVVANDIILKFNRKNNKQQLFKLFALQTCYTTPVTLFKNSEQL